MKRKTCSLGWFLLLPLLAGEPGAAGAETLVVGPGEEIQVRPKNRGTVVEAVLDSGVPHPIEGPVRAPDEGDHWLVVSTRDDAGRRSEVQWIRVVVDGEAPVLRWTFTPEPFAAEDGRRWIPRHTVLTVAAADRPAGVGELEVFEGETVVYRGSDEATWSPGGTGGIILSSTAVDTVGNVSRPEVVPVWVDETPPHGSLEIAAGRRREVAGRWIVPPSATLEISWVDDGSGVGETSLEADGQVVADPATLSPWFEGEHRVVAAAADGVGNPAAPLGLDFVVDGTPPEIEWSLVSNHLVDGDGTVFVRTPVSVEVRAEDAPAGLDTLEWQDGGRWSGVTGIVDTAADRLHLRAVDAVGNVREREIGWTVDDTPPAISLVDLEGRVLAETGGVIRVPALATARLAAEDAGVGVVRIGQRFGSVDFADPPEHFVFRHSGRRVLEVTATDRLGNEARRFFTVEVAP